jgi:hypothetical protein
MNLKRSAFVIKTDYACGAMKGDIQILTRLTLNLNAESNNMPAALNKQSHKLFTHFVRNLTTAFNVDRADQLGYWSLARQH